MTKKQFCIIGTDTGIGKTYVTCSLLRHLSNQNKKVAALKPIASGLTQIDNQLINTDTSKLIQVINVSQTAYEINPICYPDAVAPHIAAKIIASKNHDLEIHNLDKHSNHILEKSENIISINNKSVSTDNTLSVAKIIAASSTTVNNTEYDYLLIEGCGGLLVPLNDNETYLDLLKAWQFPVILVVGMRLGCLNHALLTYECLKSSNIPITGWIANYINPQMPYLEDNVNFLIDKLPIPLLATAPYNQELLFTTNNLNCYSAEKQKHIIPID